MVRHYNKEGQQIKPETLDTPQSILFEIYQMTEEAHNDRKRKRRPEGGGV